MRTRPSAIHVATVIAPRKDFRLTDEHVAALACSLGANAQAAEWLSPGEAADIFFDGDPLTPGRALQQAGLAGAPLDLVIQPLRQRAKKLVVADMDSTIIRQEVMDELADAFGLKEKIAPITRAAMEGRVDFADALRERAALLAGMPVEKLEQVRKTRISYTYGAATLTKTLAANGVATALASGGFTVFADAVAKELGFDFALSNVLEAEGNRLSGRVREPVVDSAAKRDFLRMLAGKLGLAPQQTLAIGDGANDVLMMQAAGFSIGFRAKPKAAEAAAANLRHASLEGVLFALGIPRRNFTE